MEVNFLFDDKIQPNGVDFDENASITWTIRGNHETETFILTRDPDTHEITAYEANHGVLNIEQLQEEASRIGVADVSLSNRVTSDGIHAVRSYADYGKSVSQSNYIGGNNGTWFARNGIADLAYAWHKRAGRFLLRWK